MNHGQQLLLWLFVALFCLRDEASSRLHRRGGCSSACSACLDYLSSLSPFGNVLVIFALFLLMFGILGVSLFRGRYRGCTDELVMDPRPCAASPILLRSAPHLA